jgi:hypothetical protein
VKAKQRNRPVTEQDLVDIGGAVFHLQEARHQLKGAGAHNAAKYVSRALKSVVGAQNNAERMLRRQQREAVLEAQRPGQSFDARNAR